MPRHGKMHGVFTTVDLTSNTDEGRTIDVKVSHKELRADVRR